MDPVEFLEVADRLQSSTAEAERRTSIGRSYYALYNVLYDFLFKRAVILTASSENHSLVVYYFTKCGNPLADKLADSLKTLRWNRIDADYKMSNACVVRSSQFAFKKAKEGIDAWNALKPSDRDSLARSIKAVPPKST
jgi:hypothetical protein